MQDRTCGATGRSSLTVRASPWPMPAFILMVRFIHQILVSIILIIIGRNLLLILLFEAEEHILPPSEDSVVAEPVVECKDIGVVLDETKPVPSVTDLMDSDKDEEEKVFQSPDAKEFADDKFAKEEEAKALQNPDAKEVENDKFSGEEEDVKEEDNKAQPECVVFSVGKLKVNGIGALCSFGVAAATVCIFLIGGRLQHHHKQQQQKIQLQFYGDDKVR
ncbi:hypothetical protein HU200_015883 [Digitaria exilis]|uniref:DUF6821 domain-containing protein n=1 Tax=Digitaria exilis TaxID=1010633 RepID=A0A835KIX2_9POAL|nr:hypothetical protein HU200_015883 [Digitaria exilis]